MSWFEPMLRFASVCSGQFLHGLWGCQGCLCQALQRLGVEVYFPWQWTWLQKFYMLLTNVQHVWCSPIFPGKMTFAWQVYFVQLAWNHKLLSLQWAEMINSGECSVFISWCSTFLFPSLRIIPPRTPQQKKLNGQSVYAQNNMNISGNIVKYPRKSQIFCRTSAP